MKTRRNALLSVSRKNGIVEFARGLQSLGFNVISSGGTARVLRDAELSAITDVTAISGLQPILGHRVMTLVPKIHAGLLARGTAEHIAELEELNARWIHLVCMDLYPLEEAIAKPGATRESILEMTDIDRSAILRLAAKGRRIVICDPADRALVLDWLKAGEPDAEAFVNRLCAKAEGRVAEYCLTSARAQSGGAIDGMVGTETLKCTYGENPYMKAGLYRTNDHPLAIHRFRQVAGGAPSMINLTDLDRAKRTVLQIAAGCELNFVHVPGIAVAVKHGNACGASAGDDAEEVLWKMIEGNPLSIHGATVVTNFPLDATRANILRTHRMETGKKRILGGVAAPEFTNDAAHVLERAKGLCRMFVNPTLAELTAGLIEEVSYRPVCGGFIRQDGKPFILNLRDPRLNTPRGPLTSQEEHDLILAWGIGSTSNSNTITLAYKGQLLADAVGQQDRVGGCELAVKRARDAGHDPKGAVAYSDSFFPFEDGPKVLIEAGIRAIFATSGSINDVKVRAVCEEAGVRLYLLPDTAARGFFGH